MKMEGKSLWKKEELFFLNGVTSAGKTSIVEALQECGDVFFYVVTNDRIGNLIMTW